MNVYFRKPIVKTLMLKGEKGDTGDSDYQPAVDTLGTAIRTQVSELKGDIDEISKNSLTVDSEGYICLS